MKLLNRLLQVKSVTMKCDCCGKVEKFDHIPTPAEGWLLDMPSNSVMCVRCSIYDDVHR